MGGDFGEKFRFCLFFGGFVFAFFVIVLCGGGRCFGDVWGIVVVLVLVPTFFVGGGFDPFLCWSRCHCYLEEEEDTLQ